MVLKPEDDFDDDDPSITAVNSTLMKSTQEDTDSTQRRQRHICITF